VICYIAVSAFACPLGADECIVFFLALRRLFLLDFVLTADCFSLLES
jgi:hypothetical protein